MTLEYGGCVLYSLYTGLQRRYNVPMQVVLFSVDNITARIADAVPFNIQYK